MNLADTTSRIETAARAVGLDVPAPDDTEKLILVGLQILANREQGTERRSQFQKSYTVSLTSGIASLAALTDLLVDYIENIRHSDGKIISLLPAGADETTLTFKRNTLTYWGARRAFRLMVYKGTGTVAPDGYVTMDAGFVPLLADLPEVYADNLIQIVVGLIVGTELKDEQTAAA